MGKFPFARKFLASATASLMFLSATAGIAPREFSQFFDDLNLFAGFTVSAADDVITINGSDVKAGETVQFTAEIPNPVGPTTWYSFDETIATVDQNGLITPIQHSQNSADDTVFECYILI